MPEDDVSLREATRRFEEASARLTNEMSELSRQLREDRHHASETYVRKDVAKIGNDAIIRRVDELEKDQETRDKEARDTRRQLMFLVLAFALPAIASLLLSVNTYLSSGR
jgi:hypothetical protein